MLQRFTQQTARMMTRASRQAKCNQNLYRGLYRASSIYMSRRHKTYLVGVDGSDYGYNALRTTARSAVKHDKVIAMYFPTSIALFMERSSTFHLSDDQIDVMKKDLGEAQIKNIENITKKCTEILEKEITEKDVVHYVKIGHESFTPRQDMVNACYDTKADVLCVGSKGLSHSLAEKVSDAVRKVGGLADFAVHHAPCDVLVVKNEHEY